VLLSGCAASGPVFYSLEPVPDGEALVYIYRPHTWESRNTYLCVFENDTNKGPLRDNGYLSFPAPATKIDLLFKPCSFLQVMPTPGRSYGYTFTLELDASARHFIRFEVGERLRFPPDGVLIEEVPEDQALVDMQGLKRSE
ncbi:MAG: hypothetical protein R3217_09540, partial [Gammaproteobacteria bacterium]|nr:hypothetical protein [Gammaproteobacteria bacterium]